MITLTIKPVKKPPILTKYSCLSEEAQKTLAVIEAKYSNLIMHKHNTRKGSSDYYLSIYNATFKKRSNDNIKHRTTVAESFFPLLSTKSQNISLNPSNLELNFLNWNQDSCRQNGVSCKLLNWKNERTPVCMDRTPALIDKISINNSQLSDETMHQQVMAQESCVDFHHQQCAGTSSSFKSKRSNLNPSLSKKENANNKTFLGKDLTSEHCKTDLKFLNFEESNDLLQDSALLLLTSSGKEDSENMFESPNCNLESEESPTASKKHKLDASQNLNVDNVNFDLHFSDFELSQKSLGTIISPALAEDPLVSSEACHVLKSNLNNESPTIYFKKTESEDVKSDSNQNQKKDLQTVKNPMTNELVNESSSADKILKKKKLNQMKLGDLASKTENKDPLKEQSSSQNIINLKRKRNEFRPPVKIIEKEIPLSQPEIIKLSNLKSTNDLLTKLETYQTVAMTYLYTESHGSVNTLSAVDYSKAEVKDLHKPKYFVIVPQFRSTPECYKIEVNISNKDHIKNILLTILASIKCTKIIVNLKEFLNAVQRYFELDLKQELLCNNCQDPSVAAWMLDPELPSESYSKICQIAGIRLKHEDNDWLQCLCNSFVLMKTLEEKLKLQKLWTVFTMIEMRITLILSKMELSPIHLDMAIFIKYSDILKSKLQRLEEIIFQEAGHKFCLNSHVQLRQVIYDELKLDRNLPDKRKVALTNAFHLKSTSESSLNILSAYHVLPSLILQYRQLQKLKSTYIDGIISCAVNSTLSSHWSQTAAATGRIISYQPNIQAIPKVATVVTDYQKQYFIGSHEESRAEILARLPYISSPGHVLLAADYQQIELRLLAHLCEDAGLLSTFWQLDSQDIFISLTSQWYNKPKETVTSIEREKTKRVVYAITYGVGHEKLSEYLKVPNQIAKEIVNSFLKKFPAIECFMKKCWSYVADHGYTQTICGRKRYFPHIKSSSQKRQAQAQRQAVNFCVQGSAADICKLAMICIDEKLSQHKHLRCKLLLQIHDELIWEVPENQLLEIKGILQGVMEDKVKMSCGFCSLRVPLPVVFSSGKSWAHLVPL